MEKVKFAIVLLVSLLILSNQAHAKDRIIDCVTIEGLCTFDVQPWNMHLETSEGIVFLSGVEELYMLAGLHLRVTGILLESNFISVHGYEILEEGWHNGLLTQDGDKIILVGDNQMIFEVVGPYEYTYPVRGSIKEAINKRVAIQGRVESIDECSSKLYFNGRYLPIWEPIFIVY